MATSPWDILPPEIVVRIASFLPPNEVACSFRLVNKFTSKQCLGWKLVRLSQSVPHHAFVKRWGDEQYVRDLTFQQRQELLCLAARSGVIANLEFAVAVVGCPLSYRAYIVAAERGHRDACIWLEDRGCPRAEKVAIQVAARAGHAELVRWKLQKFPDFTGRALDSAAGGGHRALCEELLAAGAGPSSLMAAASQAAGGGHVELTEWLLGLVKEWNWDFDFDSNFDLLVRAAHGFELPALQRVYHSRLGSSEEREEFRTRYGASIAAAALASPTPDWRAKLEWLEAEAGCRLYKEALHSFWVVFMSSAMLDTLGRASLLRERGMLHSVYCLHSAVSHTNLPLIQYLKSTGLLAAGLDGDTMETAAKKGDLAVLMELLAAGAPIGPDEVLTAARHGHLHVLRWMAGPESGPVAAEALRQALAGADLARCGAASGSLELMEWLWVQGCQKLDEKAFDAAVEAGNAALLEWMVERGCPMSSEAYLVAGRHCDMATLRCLRRLGCPWGAGCSTFIRALGDGADACCLEVLRWLEAEGCPVNWHEAWAKMKYRVMYPEGPSDVSSWIREHIVRNSGPGARSAGSRRRKGGRVEKA